MSTQAGWNADIIAVDWGTTNRRAYRLSRGAVADSFDDEFGILAVKPGGFDRHVAEIRDRLGDLPMLLAGMVGSNKGWQEAAYVPCPAGPAEVAANIHWVDDRIGIVPGVSQLDEPDVMRGEEVQAFGAAALRIGEPDALICHPGTHAKWIRMAEGRIASFKTAMTGEFYNLLKTHSILADQLQGPVAGGAALDAGFGDALERKPLLSALFAIRASYVLGLGDDDHASYASGLLIGADVVAAIECEPDATIALVGRSDLCALYARAAELAGRQAIAIDGTQAFVAGIDILRRHLP